MRNSIGAGRFLLLTAGVFLPGCSLVSGSIPAMVDAAVNLNPLAHAEPSNTPFLPALYTETPSPTEPPTRTPSPTFTVWIPPTETCVPTETMTEIVLPSVTPVTPSAVTPTKKPYKPPVIVPSPTPTAKVDVPPAATYTKKTGPPVAPTSTAIPLPTVTSPPAGTARPTAAPTGTRAPASSNCATFNYEYEAQVAAMINTERQQLGLDPLVLNGILTQTARAHSVDMVVNKFMAHTGSDGSTAKERIARAGFSGSWWGEIIAGGTPSIAVKWWLNEPGHRDVIVSKHYTDFGVGYAICPGQGWFTVDFGGP
jgi:uncharacterized protein YkwD